MTSISKDNCCLVWDKFLPDLWLSFCLNFCRFLWLFLTASGEVFLQKPGKHRLFKWKISVVYTSASGTSIHFNVAERFNRLVSTWKWRLQFNGCNLRDWTNWTNLHLVKRWEVPNLTKLFINTRSQFKMIAIKLSMQNNNVSFVSILKREFINVSFSTLW